VAGLARLHEWAPLGRGELTNRLRVLFVEVLHTLEEAFLTGKVEHGHATGMRIIRVFLVCDECLAQLGRLFQFY
jgi:hypothetical protein